MSKSRFLSTGLLSVCLAVAAAGGCSDSPVTDDPDPTPTPAIPKESTVANIAFVDVNVVSMMNDQVLANHTVLVSNGRIAAVGPSASVNLPQGTVTIKSEGAYLMPGLSDMHVHMTSESPDGENDLFLYIANGVTTVRVMEGDETMLKWRDEIAAGTRVGPTMFVAGKPLDGPDSGSRFLITHPAHVMTAEEGRQIVRDEKAAGYDYIKIYNTLEPVVYRAIMNEARVENIKAIGHIPVTVELEDAIDARQHSTEHINPFARSVVLRSGSARCEGQFLDQPAAEGAAVLAASGMWSCPTLAFYQRSEANSPETSSDLRYVSSSIQTGFTVTGSEPTTPSNTRKMVKALHDAGAPMILGTWVGARFLLPGFSVLEEVTALNQAGLTPYEVLKTATVNAAASVAPKGDFGSIEVGKRADLLFLKSNPLARVRDIDRRLGVMVRGHWFSEDRLKERLEEIATSYGR